MSQSNLLGQNIYFIPTEKEYASLLIYAKKVSYQNYNDIVHDSLLSASNFEDCIRKISGGKFFYKSVNHYKEQENTYTDLVCKKCGEIKPQCEFDVNKKKGLEYFRTECKPCRRAYFRANWHKKKNSKKQNIKNTN